MISTSDSYAAFQRRMNSIAADMQKLPPGFLGYTQNEVASRLLQRCAELGVFEFTRIAAATYRRTGALPADTEQVVCAGVVIDGDGSISLEPAKFMRLLMEFFAHWGQALVMILLSIRLTALHRKVSLLYGVGLANLLAEGSDARFINFCRVGPIAPLSAADHLLVQAMRRVDSTEPSRVKYGRDPLLMASRWSGLGFRTWLYALGQHLFAAISFLQAVCIRPTLLLLGRDAASHSVAAALNREGSISDVVFTTSNFFSQPLWFWALPQRTYTNHIAWYSQNNYPISYADEVKAVLFPNLRYIKADVQWVWSKGFKEFLSSVSPNCTYHVVGPIVWHLPSRIVGTKNRGNRIILFDVTPVNETTEIKLGLLRNLYTEKNMSTFIQDVVDVAQMVAQELGTKVEVVLKHKRPHHSIHSSEYIQTIASMADTGAITLIDPTANMYDLVLDSDLVIACPYSSPVYLGRARGKEAFWYDPTATLKWMLGEPEIPLVQGKTDLASRVRKTYGI